MRQLGDLIESIHIMQYTCSVLLILQAMSFLRVAKGYARLGPSLLALHAGIREFTIECVAGIVTQTLAYAKSELLHFSAIFFFVLFIYAQSGHFMCKGRGNPFSICRAVRLPDPKGITIPDGADMEEFHSVATGFQTCFDILLGKTQKRR